MGKDINKKQSLTFVLSIIVAVIIVIMFAIFIGIMRTNFVNTSEALYVDQLQNFSNDIGRQMEDFLETEMYNAKLIAKDPRVIAAMKTGNYEAARPLLKGFYFEKGIYEQVFISTLEKNSLIVASGNSKADGVRWGEIPVYVQNVASAMKGETHTSEPGKSPVTGLAVILVTAPVMDGSTPIGIVGLPVNIGVYSDKIVKKIKIGKTGYSFITDSHGLTFAHPDEKNIFKLNINDYEWGKEILGKPSGTLIHYQWGGEDKILTFQKNDRFHFIAAATLYSDDYMSEIRRLDLFLFPLAVVLFSAAILFIIVFMRRRLKPLADCEVVMSGMAEGDLSLRYNGVISNDEIGRIAGALNNTLNQFEKLISEIISTSKNLSHAVNEISTGNQDLSQRTSEQASSLEEVASTIEEATAAIRQNADNSAEADRLSENTMKLGEEGNRVVMEAVASINEISSSSQKIEEIISLINEIAFQTNLLALNAAVEAARAGEQGRGFAVVAGEVRNLAQRSANAAKEIRNLIKDSLEKITTGTELANRSGESLNEIVGSMKSMARLISEIAASSQEQKQGIDQINIAVSEMDILTQQNAALVEETAATSEEVAVQAKDLENMVEKFIVTDTYSTKKTVERIKAKQTERAAESVSNKKTEIADQSDDEGFPVKGKTETGDILKDEGFDEF